MERKLHAWQVEDSGLQAQGILFFTCRWGRYGITAESSDRSTLWQSAPDKRTVSGDCGK